MLGTEDKPLTVLTHGKANRYSSWLIKVNQG